MGHAEEPIPEDVTEKALSTVKDKQKFRRQMGGERLFCQRKKNAQRLRNLKQHGMLECEKIVGLYGLMS